MHNPGFQARLTTFSADHQERSSCLAHPACASISGGEKSRNRKWVFEKRGLPKREIWLNMPFFTAYGMNVEKFHLAM
ncbi:MAG: hypothetical protein GX946_09885 [Oligosphaeraceae bacterium]|nr:hypothetical protein [Oligosphaeraceae bacterium]